MTPFGAKLRALRDGASMTQAQLAQKLGISPAYLSSLEHGKRGRPSWAIVQQVIEIFGLIWDDAEELEKMARLSHPKVMIDTSDLSPKATELANRLARVVQRLDDPTLDSLLNILDAPKTKGE